MASSSEIDVDPAILEQVRQAVIRVAEIQAESAEEEDGLGHEFQQRQQQGEGPETAEELLERRQRELEEQVASLEAEVKQLEEQVAERERAGGSDAQLESAILSLVGGAGAVDVEDGEALLSRLVESVDPEASQKERDWQAQVRLNEAITGVKFTSVNWEIKHKDDSVLIREHTHIGTVSGYHFKAIFVVSEEKSEESNSDAEPELARIIDMKLEVDPRARDEMSPFLSETGSAASSTLMELDPIAFYRTYTRYCLFHKERADTFQEAKSMFADRVHLAESSSGTRLYLSDHKGLKLTFSWKVIVTPQGDIKRSIRFQPKTPANASEELTEVLVSVPQLLEKMIMAYGHKQGFLKLLSLFNPSNVQSESEQ